MCFMDHKAQSSIGDSLPNKAMEGKSSKPKEKRRNNEKRKEKSRDAARCRRSRETEIFNELGETLPIGKDELDNLDKASVMRLAIATLKIEEMMKLFQINSDAGNPIQIVNNSDENAVMNALDGFLIALSAEGDVTYVSENIHEYIGIQQIDMIGNPIWDYTHQCDHIELRDILNSRRLETLCPDQTLDDSGKMSRNALIRIKCTLTSRGRNVNIKSASYKVINIVGHTVVDERQHHHQFIGIARLVPHPSNIEVPLDSKTFLSKHTLKMEFSYVDDKMLPILGYKPNDLLEKSLYEYHHGADSEMLMNAFKNVINKGQTETPQYRFLGRNGGFCWVVSQATLVYDKQKPQSVVCVNYVISGLINENDVYSLRQLEALNTLPQNKKVKKIQEKPIEFKLENIQIEDKGDHYQEIPDLDIGKNHLLTSTYVDIENTKSSIPNNNGIRRLFFANQLNITPIKGNPKAVTASVFKTLPSGVNVLKKKLNLPNNTNVQQANKPTPPSSKRITPLFMKTESVDIREPFGRSHSTISEPSIIPRQTVVTASLFQTRRQKKEIVPSNPSTELYFTETMNKTFGQTNDDKFQTTSLKPNEDVDSIRKTTASTLSSNPVMSQKANNSSSFGILNHLPAIDPLNDNSFISLGESTPLFGEIYNGFILPDGYCTSIPEEIPSIDEQSGKTNIENDFTNYEDGRNLSPGKLNNALVSSNMSKSSECSSSLPSLCSPNSMNRNEEFTFMSTSLDNDDINLSMRAPYIPMNENDDLPLLTEEDLMWSAFSEEVSLHKDIKNRTELQLQPSQQQSIISGNMDRILMNDTQKKKSSIDGRFVLPILNSCINTKYIDSENTVSNTKETVEKVADIEHVQRQTSMKDSCAEVTIINNVISIDSEDMLTKESIVDCSLEPTAIRVPQKDDEYNSGNETIQTYLVQHDAFIKHCADDILSQWTLNNSPKNDVSGNNWKNGQDPSSRMFRYEIQSEKSDPNIMNSNHKRGSSLEIGVTKRLKSHINTDYFDLNEIEKIQQPNSSPTMKCIEESHLLQQLMAPTPQRIGKVSHPKSEDNEENSNEITQWNHNVGLNRLENQSSDSVLKNLLCKGMTTDASSLSVTKTPDGASKSNMMQRIQIIPEKIKIETEVNSIDNDSLNIHGLIEDVFLTDESNPNSADPIKETQSLYFTDDEMAEALSCTISEKKPFESFEKQIIISVTQPPPLQAEAFTIGGGLFQGITDHTSILPTSLISPIETSDFSGFNLIKPEPNNLMDIWNFESE